ncbi:FecR domain-containing protein [Altererythrobacter sp. H2]|uniref:FecR domain-containing protein n=1 Tax=Altererythrobacter sp. H2 TaxID=3108391 RepID=UPI002B4C01E4|nr:FecR domain-containing protein [Altererythrobacter sp. H2]WRK97106.1 FecR domain-containing protein [Altererythrobacter sp. H2]
MRSDLILIGSAALGLSLAPAEASDGASSRDDVIYTIKPGDTLIDIGRKYLISPQAYRAVQRHNAIRDPLRLRPQTRLAIPVQYLKATLHDAQVVAFRGTVQVLQKGQAAPVQLQMRLVEGATIETGSDGFVTLQLANGSRMSMPSNTRLRIARMRTYRINRGADLDFQVERGRVETKAAPLDNPASRFRIRTPVAVTAVRGTVFRVGYSGPGAPSTSEVVEGKVSVDHSVVPAQVDLATGFGAAASQDGALEREELLPAPMLAGSAKLQRDPELTFALVPSDAARGYQVQIARDAGFVDVLAEGRSNTPSLTFADLPNGTYFLRAMAIAPSGLVGLAETHAFLRNRESASAAALPGPERAFRFDWNLGDAGPPAYRLQIFAAQNQAVPVVDEPGLTAPGMTVTALPNGKYTWRVGQVRVIDGTPEEYWTPLESFSIDF